MITREVIDSIGALRGKFWNPSAAEDAITTGALRPDGTSALPQNTEVHSELITTGPEWGNIVSYLL